MAMTKGRILAGLRIGFFGRGGAGKSTAIVLIAHALRALLYRVVVVDADSTNLGLAEALGVPRPPLPLIDYFGGIVFSGGKVTCPVDDPTLLPGRELDLEEIPERFLSQSADGIDFLTVGKIGGRGPGAGCDGPMAKIARDVRLRTSTEDPVTLLDFKAGLEDSARGVLTGLDWALVVIDASSAGLSVAMFMNDLLMRARAGEGPAVAHLERAEDRELARRLYRESTLRGAIYVLSKVGDANTAEILHHRLGASGIEVAGTIPFDGRIAECWLSGGAIDPTPTADGVHAVVLALEEAERAWRESTAVEE